MADILIINGSPNKNGHTRKVLKALLEGIDSNDLEIREIDCYEHSILPCIDCKYCSRVKGKCLINDYMDSVYDLIRESKIIILASPMYFGMFPGTLKNLIDRCQVLWSEKYVFSEESTIGKKGFLIFDGGTSWRNMFDPMETIAKYFLNTINCDITYKILVDNTDNNKDYLLTHQNDITECQNIINGYFSEK